MPNADHVLIIDVPDLHADVFQFAQGLLMLSESAAAKLLPDASLNTQAALSLVGGSTLKLIGVVDLHPAASA